MSKKLMSRFSRLAWRSTLCSSASAIALMGSINVAYAQEEIVQEQEVRDQDQVKDDIEVIEVLGIRRSQIKNLEMKRMSNAVVDVITAEDIGKFPDKNVADSLQRVPGVVISRNGGEGQNVSIRGLSSSLTYTQLNGNYIASAPGSPSRSFNYVLLPSALIQSVEVYKSSEARLDEGGVGGTIIQHTRTPFKMEANSGVLNIESTYSDTTDKFEPQFAGVYSWKDEDETLGFLVGLVKQNRTNRTLGSELQDWKWRSSDGVAVDSYGKVLDASNSAKRGTITDAHGEVFDQYWVPNLARASVTNENRERQGVQFTVQWRPIDDLELTANYFGFSLTRDFTGSYLDIPEWSLNSNFLDKLTTEGNVVTGADYTVGASGLQEDMQFPWMRGQYVREEETSDTYDFKAVYQKDDFKLTLVAGHTEAEGGPVEQWDVAFKSSNWAQGDDYIENAAQYAGWNVNDDQLDLYMDPNTLDRLLQGVGGAQDPGSSNSSFEQSTIEEDYIQADFEYYLDGDFISTIQAGVKYRKSELTRLTGNTFFLDPDFDIQAALDSGEGIDRFDSYQWNGGMPEVATYLKTQGEGNIAGGFGINLMPVINWDEYTNYVKGNYNEYSNIEDQNIYMVEEEITAAYIQADYEYNDLRGNFGVRVVQTKTSGTSTDKFTYLLDYLVDGTDNDYVTGDDRFRELYTTITQSKTRTNVLPSFNLVWDAGEDLVIRGAAAKVMSRPEYGDLGGQETLQYISEEWVNDRPDIITIPGWTGGGGNKELLPFEALQYDLSAEYYYGEGQAVGIAFFYKDIDNFIVPLVISADRVSPGIDGVSEVPVGDIFVDPYNTIANGTDATSQGIEIFAQHDFGNGYGLVANYTLNDTSQANVSLDGEQVGESPLIGTADFQFNFSAYFENEDFSVRASYNLRGEQVLGLQSNGLNYFSDEYDQIDVNASYEIAENLTASVSIINLTQNQPVTRLGDDTDARFVSTSYSGRRLYAGINYSF